MDDYYATLGISRNATPSEIKAAFRRLVHRLHPDVCEDKEDAEKRLMRILEAYEVLSDPEKRRAYDEAGSDEFHSGSAGSDTRHLINSDELEDVVAGEVLEELFKRRRGSGPVKGRDLRVHVELTLEEAFRGVFKEVEIPRASECPECGGTGARRGGRAARCPICSGLGQVKGVMARGSSRFVTVESCPRCFGTGTVIDKECARCAGRGRVRTMVPVRIRIPEGVEDGAVLRMPEEAGEGLRGGPRGDLYLMVRVRPHAVFRREARDLHRTAEASFALLALGGKLRVETLDGIASVRIPPGTQTHTTFRLQGLGMPSCGSHGRGDLYVTVVVRTPRVLTGRQKELLAEFEREEGSAEGRAWLPRRR
ncbi:MAG: J domain-containing protein [Thermoplasmata archaeon]